MSLRHICSAGLIKAAAVARRVSSGLLFAAGGARRIADFKDDAASYFADYNARGGEVQCGLNPLEQRIYGRHVRAGARVCVIGCGTGRDLLPFVEHGHVVTGVEPSPAPVEILRRALIAQGLTATLITAFVEDAPVPGPFDAIILSPHCYSYIPGSERRVEILKRLALQLSEDGRIAINFLRRTGSWSGAGVGVAGLVARVSGSDCPWEPHDIVQLNERDGRRSITFEHFFLPAEVEQEVVRAGLRVIETEVDDFLGPITIVGREPRR